MLVGTCTEFCPKRERIERLKTNQVDPLFERTVLIKRYNRPAAGKAAEEPEDVRSPQVLYETVEYLFTETLAQADFPKCYPFIWDRLWAVRQDLTFQQSSCVISRKILARCIRFYTLSRFICSIGVPRAIFDPKVNDRHLVDTLGKLIRIYDEFNTEDEDRAQMESLFLLLNLQSYRRLQRAFNLLPRIQARILPVLRLAKAAVSSNFYRVLRESNNLDIVQWCVAHDYLNFVRLDTLRTLNVAFSSGACAFPLNVLSSWLYCDDESCRKLLQYCGITLNDKSNVHFSRTRKFTTDKIPVLEDNAKKQNIVTELSAILL